MLPLRSASLVDERRAPFSVTVLGIFGF
jgi:hypothetical protein